MPTPETTILDEGAVSEIEAQLNSGSLLLPLRVEGWHKSLTDGGWFVKNASGRVLMTVSFVPVELETGKPALEGNAPARHTVALLNSIPALCATVKHLRAKHEQLALASGEWATLLDRVRAWSKCKDGYPLDEHVNNITVDRERLQSQLEQLRAENERLKDELIEPSCWHCGVVLTGVPKPRCEDCPTECDVINCDALGCADKLAEQHLDSWK